MKGFLQSTAICCECGNEYSFWRKVAKIKKEGHIKDIYCVKCKNITKHKEKKISK